MKPLTERAIYRTIKQGCRLTRAQKRRIDKLITDARKNHKGDNGADCLIAWAEMHMTVARFVTYRVNTSSSQTSGKLEENEVFI